MKQLLILAMFALIVLTPVSADIPPSYNLTTVQTTPTQNVLVYGERYNYSEVVLPNASYVHQGENISQGFWYDLSGVYGFHGMLGHWNDEDDIGFTAPDVIFELSDHPHKMTYISESEFPVGRWYQWDGKYCSEDKDYCSFGFQHGNNYVFAVVKNITPPVNLSENSTIDVQETIIVFSSNGSESINITKHDVVTMTQSPVVTPIDKNVTVHTLTVKPTPTAEPTAALTPTARGTIDPNNPDPNIIPEATVKSPLPVFAALFALAFVVLTSRRW